jgi:phosphoglycolate phosphatase
MNVPLLDKWPKLALLDWDGTFCDSRESIYEINLTMAKHYGKVMPSYDEWLNVAHPSVEACMKSIGVTEDRLSINQLFHELLLMQREKGLQNPLYEGTHDLLSCFRELSISAVIISRHLHEHLILDVKAHGLSEYFEQIIGEPKGVDLIKSHEISKICAEFNVAPNQVFYLGDTVHDMLAARKAGVVSIAISHGYDPRVRLKKKACPDLIVDSLAEFQSLLV